jgi:hypothetical protein
MRLYVESQRNGDIERVKSHHLVVAADIHEQSLLVGKVVVVFEFVVNQFRVCR